MRHPRRTAALGLAIALASGAPDARAQTTEHAIGTLGAHVALDATWKRQKLSADLGPDQFNGSETRRLLGATTEVYAVVSERRGLHENEADYRRALDEEATLGHDAPIEVVREAGWTRASRVFEAEVDRMKIAWRCDLLVRDGLAYHVMAWAPRSQRANLDRRAKVFRDAIVFPGADSAFHKGLAHKQHRITTDEVQLTFAVPASLLDFDPDAGADAGGGITSIRLASADDTQSCGAWEATGYDTLQELADAEAKTLREWNATFAELGRKETPVDGVPGLTLRGTVEGATLQCLLLLPKAGKGLVIRYHSTGAVTDARPVRDALFASVRCTKLGEALALPALPAATRSPAPDTRLTRFLAVATVRHRLPAQAGMDVRRLADGSLCAVGWRQVHHLEGEQARVVWADQERRASAATRWGKDWLVLIDGQVHRLDGAALVEPALSPARLLATAGDDLLLLRDAAPPPPGLADFARPRPQLVRRTPAGTESVVATLPGLVGHGLAVSADGTQAAVSGQSVSLLTTHTPRQSLWNIDLRSGKSTRLGEFDEIQAVGPAHAGWLLTGRPAGQPMGIWLVGTGAPQPLVTGTAVRGIDATADRVAISNWQEDSPRIAELPLLHCQQSGRLCQPFGPRQVEAVGSRLIAELGAKGAPATAADLAEARRRADAIAGKEVGATLPDTVAGVDELIAAAQDWQRPLDEDGRTLLAVLVAATAIASGAEWVPGERTDWAAWRARPGLLPDTAFATCNVPAELVAAAADEDRGDALGPVLAQAQGRVSLLGLDGARVLARAAALVPEDLEQALAQPDAARLRKLLDGLPGNLALRSAIWSELAGHGHLRALEDLAQPWAARPDALATDVVPYLLARDARAQSAADAKDLFERAMALAPRFPGERAIYLVLGNTAARAFPTEPQKARQCWKRVLEISNYGDVADAARKALADLDRR